MHHEPFILLQSVIHFFHNEHLIFCFKDWIEEKSNTKALSVGYVLFKMKSSYSLEAHYFYGILYAM